MTKEFNASILPQPHFIMVDTFNGTLENLKLNNEGALELVDGAIEGKYTSEEISCHDFYAVFFQIAHLLLLVHWMLLYHNGKP